MSKEYEWDWFECYVTGVIETVIASQHRTLDIYNDCAEMASSLIRGEAKRRFILKPEEDD